ncbi:hypothetical protein FJT64_027267 [Amphibalanus amphitrite]|uniref:Uncharacterized protein n=1 Tax=Amphibalanus amphitrite TaxID=1232801 RepID=A0A6A4W4G5_AMPAM|nr:hypothetical protein FJT64_027267 [Amphibalanus amphitrite]
MDEAPDDIVPGSGSVSPRYRTPTPESSTLDIQLVRNSEPSLRGAGGGAEDATVASPPVGVPGAQIGNGTYKRSVPEPEFWIVTVLKFAPEHVDESFVRDVEARLSKAFNDAYAEYRKRRRRERREAPGGRREQELELPPQTQPGSEGRERVYVHNVNVENNRTRLLYTAWQDGQPLRAVDAVTVVSDAIDDREMSVRMGHVVEVTKVSTAEQERSTRRRRWPTPDAQQAVQPAPQQQREQ